MATRVVMPKLTDTMEEGTVLSWKKKEGETVAAGDALAEIETDKAVMDLEAFGSGTLRKILVGAGQTVKSGALIAVIAAPDEDIDAALSESIGAGQASGPEVKPKPTADVKAARQPVGKVQAETKTEEKLRGEEKRQPEKAQVEAKTEEQPRREEKPREVKASPRARMLAAERGIDLRTIRGTGPDGRIIERDIPEGKGGAPATAVESPAAAERPLSQMRKAIARTMTQSKAPVPHFYLMADIDMAEAERIRMQIKQSRRTHPSVTDLLIKAAALALTKHPEMNVSFAGERITQHGRIDIGIAVGMDEGLITPVIRNCGHKSLWEIARESRELIERTRGRKLQPKEYSDATFTISNLGMFDVENFVAVLVPPQAASLAIGTIADVPIVEDGAVTIGRRMKVTLSCDHRVLDGMQAAQFLQEFKRILEHPIELLLPEGE